MKTLGIMIMTLCFVCTAFSIGRAEEQKGQKGEYQNQMETRLKDFNKKMEELKTKAKALSDDAKREFDKEMKEFQKKQEVADKKLKELKSASAKAWDKIKAEMESAVDELDKQYNKMMSYFKKT